MSLHTLAQHLQSAGRGEDKVLVHMTPGEVSGLQSLAMAHGGSLSINPETGLPEAGFLSSILPMVAGAALTATGVGAPMAALMVGAAGTVATGSLNKGLMMGLGAYGGASLGAGLGLAPAAAASSAAPAAASSAAAPTAFAGGTPFTMPTVVPPATAGIPAAGITAAGAPAAGTPFTAAVPTTPVVSTAPAGAPATTAPASVEASIGDRLKTAGQNVGKLFGSSEEDKAYRDAFLKEQKYPLMSAGISALSLSREDPRLQKEAPSMPFNPSWNRMMQSGGNYQAGAYPSATGERKYFAEGGLANLPVEQMSQQASTGQNTNYPMANIRPYGYAVPRNNPISENVVKPADYQNIDPYTGQQKFADGGLASLVSMATGGFVSKLKKVEQPKKVEPKLQSTAALDKKLASLEKYNNIDDYQNQISEINSQIADLSKDKKANAKKIAELNAKLKVANAGLSSAKTYQQTAAQRDKIVAANEAATNKSNQEYQSALDKYNQYQEALAAEKQTWQEETKRKATGLQAIKPQTVTKAAIEEEEGTYTPKYVKDPVTGKLIESSAVPPKTEFKAYTKVPGFDATKKILEESDITAVFEDVAGRLPTKDEMNKLLGTVNSQAGVAAFASKMPDVVAKVDYTDDDIRENWAYYIGREPTAGELANVRAQVKAGKITNFNQMRGYIQNRPQYLENINKVAQSAFTQQQKTAQQALEEQQRMSASLSPEQVSTAYKDILGRPPTMEELRQYMGAQQTQEGLAGILKGSEEYLSTLTKPMVPTPTAAPSPTPFTRYAPGTVLEYTPEQTATTGLGAITGGIQPTPSGLQTPLTRGAVTLEGAMPLNPTFMEQMGLQTLATQAAEKAPALQTGLQFEAMPAQNMFGFAPYGQPAQQSPQSVEAILAALRAQQQQGATQFAKGGMAGGGYHLGDYSDGGRLLKGPGNGTSDSIPATIADKQPARLADGEFVIPARIVSELGNGSTDAGARELYSMMDRIQRARGKTVGKNKVAVDAKARKLLPA